jgi:hypothetical protein
MRNAQNAQPASIGQRQPQESSARNAVSDSGDVMAMLGGELGIHANETDTTFALQGTAASDGGLKGFDNSFGLHDFTFADDEIWADLFAGAGFNINEGIFLPYGDSELGNMGPPT